MAAGPTPKVRPAKPQHGLVRRYIRSSVVIVLTVCYGVGFMTVHLVKIVWPRSEHVGRPDAVVVFAGGEQQVREATAVNLIVDDLGATGHKPVLVLSLGGEETVGNREVDAVCERASNRILPPSADVEVMCIVPDPPNTSGEAAAFAALAEREGWSRLVGVSSQYHVERVGLWLDRCSSARVSVAPARVQPRLGAVIHELGGIIYATAVDRTCPALGGLS